MGGETTSDTASPELWITGIASQFPPYSIDANKLRSFAGRFHDVESPGLKKFLEVNEKTGIEKRPSVSSYENGFGCQPQLPDIKAIDAFYRQAGVDLAVRACRKALRDGSCTASDITHSVAVTATNHGCPGYDILVAEKLGLSPTVESTLLQGVGCAGGLSAMRAAADAACAATMRGRPARVLVCACEVTTALLRYDLAEAEKCTNVSDLNPAAAVLSDAAAAFVLCNNDGLGEGDHGLQKAQFQLLDWKRAIVPHTHMEVGFFPDPNGYRTTLAKGLVLGYIKELIQKMLPDMLSTDLPTVGAANWDASNFDWALHPGSPVIIDGIKEMLGLEDHHVRATNEIYRARGNSGSASVIAVLSQLRYMGPGRNHIMAASYGPGVTVEMVKLKRCCKDRDGSE